MMTRRYRREEVLACGKWWEMWGIYSKWPVLLKGSGSRPGHLVLLLLCVCVKEHRREAAMEHKAITLAVVGDGMRECCTHWRREGFILCLHSKNSYATQMQSWDDGKRGEWEKHPGRVDTCWCSLRCEPWMRSPGQHALETSATLANLANRDGGC